MKRKLENGVIFILIIVILVCTGMLTYFYFSYKISAETYSDLSEEFFDSSDSTEDSSTVSSDGSDIDATKVKKHNSKPKYNYKKMKKINSDFIGWIDITGTKISYPVVQGANDSFYLSHNFKKEYDDFGCVFLDKNNTSDLSDDLSIMYGHRMKDGSMFAGIKYFLNNNYLKQHKKAQLYSESGIHTYSVEKCLEVAADSELYFLKSDSLQKYFSVKKNKKYLVLSTCTGNGHDKRVILILEETKME